MKQWKQSPNPHHSHDLGLGRIQDGPVIMDVLASISRDEAGRHPYLGDGFRVEPRVGSHNIARQGFLLFVHHDREQFAVLQSRMQEALFHVTVMGPLLAHRCVPFVLGLLRCGIVVLELSFQGSSDEDLESEDNEDWRCSRSDVGVDTTIKGDGFLRKAMSAPRQAAKALTGLLT
jgi:hypothetical protein